MADTDKRDLDAEIKEAQADAFKAIRNLELAQAQQQEAIKRVNQLESERGQDG